MLLHCLGLLRPPVRAARKSDVLAAIRRMGVLQIDTINVVARSPYFVLFSRLGHYEPRWLDELLAEGRLFEYWAHAMCFIPIEDYPLIGSLIEYGRAEGRVGYWRRLGPWLRAHRAEVEHALTRITAEGGLKSSDFKSEQKRGGGWWDIKIEKQALEHLFIDGQLAIARREKFQRVYDLRQRVIPGWNPAHILPREQVHQELTRKAAMALGVATEPWLRDYYRQHMVDSKGAIGNLLDQGELLPVQLEGVKEQAYIHRDNLPLLRKTLRGSLTATLTTLLSPFDPLVWHRARASALFDFDYLIECYTVQAKRVYGYFTLPLLHRGALIGRLDAKAHRREGVFEVICLHLEPGVLLDDEALAQVAGAIRQNADWHGLARVELRSTSPDKLKRRLSTHFAVRR